MKLLILGFVIVLFLAPGAIASEESMLVHVTCYWRNEKSGHRAAWNGAHLRAGDCAVDPRKIPYGSTIIFPDVEGVAVDTGPSVVSRKSLRALPNAKLLTRIGLARYSYMDGGFACGAIHAPSGLKIWRKRPAAADGKVSSSENR